MASEPVKSIKSGRISIKIATVLGILGIITLPGFFRYWQKVGTGHAFRQIYMDEGLRWDSMDEASRAPYVARSKAEGLKCALLMTAGQHIPLFLFILIMVGLLTPSVLGKSRILLYCSFCAIWLLGVLFLSLGIEYWGQAIPFPESLGPALVLYMLVAISLGIILGVVKLCRPRVTR